MGAGFAGVALTALLDADSFFTRSAVAATAELNPLLPRQPHFPAKAKSCIVAVNHIEQSLEPAIVIEAAFVFRFHEKASLPHE